MLPEQVGVTWADEHAFLAGLRTYVSYAFQPIVDVHTGEAFAFEALLRGTKLLGFADIPALLKRIDAEDLVLEAEMLLREKAIAGFAAFACDTGARLFFNLNNRLLDTPSPHSQRTESILVRHGLSGARLCLEISEAQSFDVARAREIRAGWRERPLVALDDFGTGHSGLRLLLESKPDLVKIDRSFVADVDRHDDRRRFLEQVVNLVHSIGIFVIAEGVETEGEYHTCRAAGCDYVQGYFIARPSTDLASLATHYPIVEATNARNRRIGRPRSADALRAHLDPVTPVPVTAPVVALLEAFQNDRTRSFFPIVTELGEPAGIAHEEQLKPLIYGPYGRYLLVNRVHPRKLTDFVEAAPVFDVNTSVDHVLSVIGGRPDVRAVMIVEDGKYIGVLDARGIIRTMHERIVALARDQNPLTKLPGNVMVADYMADALEGAERPLAFVHFDFNFFKPFNDLFGFRQGDRAITMFADLLRSRFSAPDTFVGHIGGDDFFLGVRGGGTARLVPQLRACIEQFASDMQSFYPEEARRDGRIRAVDRSGVARLVPLLSVSCALLTVEDERPLSMDVVSASLARLKTVAKERPDKIAVAAAAP